MQDFIQTALWQQLGAALDMLENAVRACPDALFHDRTVQPEFWYTAYHTLFFLDYYLAPGPEGFAPPPPFTLDELDPRGIMPDRLYTRDELLCYLQHGRTKARARIAAMTADQARQRCAFPRPDLSELQLMLQTLRHVQHHTAQLNTLLRQGGIEPPRWVVKTAQALRD
jgi:hypothetical protein